MKKSTKKGWKIVGIVFCVVHFVVSDCLWHGIWRRFYSQAGGQDAACKSAANYGCAHFEQCKKDQSLLHDHPDD